MLISYLPWVSQRQRRLLHPRLNSIRRYAALWRPNGRYGRGRWLTASCAHDVRLQAVMIVSRFARMTRRRDAAATLSRPSSECRPQGGCNDGVSPLTACETAGRRRTLQRRNCNDSVPAVDGMWDDGSPSDAVAREWTYDAQRHKPQRRSAVGYCSGKIVTTAPPPLTACETAIRRRTL